MVDRPASQSRAPLQGLLGRILADREIIIRSADRIHFVQLPRRRQILWALPVLFALGLSVFVAGGYVLQRNDLSVREAQLRQARSSYLDLLSDLADLQALQARGQVGVDATEDADAQILRETMRRRLEAFAERVSADAAAAGSADAWAARIDAARDRFAQTARPGGYDVRRDAVLTKVQELRAALARAEAEVARVGGVLGESRRSLAVMTDDRDRTVAERDGLRERLQQVEIRAATLQREGQGLARSGEGLRGELQDLRIARDTAAVERRRIELALAKSEERLVAFSRSQADVLDRFADRARRTVTGLEKTVARIGIDLEALAEEGDADGIAQGGPFVALGKQDLPKDFEKAVLRLDDTLKKWEDLQRLLSVLPLQPPIQLYEITSGFGKRIDPINRQPAMHLGMDLAGPTGTPVIAPSAGKVVFVGWKGNYGRTVEIDHGMGIRTRYAHLSKIEVEEGETVQPLERIGLLGNTGRSTGPHLHWEVLVAGRPIDPNRFLTASRYLQRR